MKRQHSFLALGLGIAVIAALWPHPSYAACDVNIGCYVDEGIVTVLRFFAQLGWFLNGNLLLLSRWLEEQRTWLVNDVMASVLDGLLQGASVAWAQAVVIAVIICIISFSLRAIVQLNWVDLKRGIRNGVFALVVFTYGAQLMAASENGRVLLSMAASQMVEQSLTTAGAARMLTGGTSRPGDLMPPAASIYPGAACGGVVPARAIPFRMINDTAANYLFATAEDIHCPSESGASENAPPLPRVFWEGGTYPSATMESTGESVNFVGFYSRAPGDAADGEDRKRIVGLAMDGVVRQFFGVFLTIPAVLEQLIHLLFALGLASLWFSLSISLVFALFVPTEGMMTSIVRVGFDLVKQSVMTTIGLGLVGFVLRTVAGSSGVNAGLVAFIGLIALVVLVLMLANTGRMIFASVSSLSGITLGGAPAALLGTMAGVGLVAGMALQGNAAGREAAGSAREHAERDAQRSGASDKEVKQAGNRAARTAYSSALSASAVRTFNGVGRAVTDAAGFVEAPLRQSMRWQDRAEADRRQHAIMATMDVRDEARADGPVGASPAAASGSAQPPRSPGAAAGQSGAAQKLRGLAPASSGNPYMTQTTALSGAAPASASQGAPPDSSASRAAQDADAEVGAIGKALQRAEAELMQVQQQRASAQGRAVGQAPSALNERELRRLEKEADGVVAQVARLRQQLGEAEQVQRQVRGDGDAQRAQGEAARTWGMVQATEGQRDPATGETPQLALRGGLGLAQQQLDQEQQRLAGQPANDPGVADDRAWLQRQQAAVGSLRRWNETLAKPDVPPADRAAGQVAIAQLRDDAARAQQVAQESGTTQRAQIAGGVVALAGAMLPVAASGEPQEAVPTAGVAAPLHDAQAPAGKPGEAVPTARAGADPAALRTGGAAPVGELAKGAAPTGSAPVRASASRGSAESSPAASGILHDGGAPRVSAASLQAAPGMSFSVSRGASLAQRLQQSDQAIPADEPAAVASPAEGAVATAANGAQPAAGGRTDAAPLAGVSAATPAASLNGAQAPAGGPSEAVLSSGGSVSAAPAPQEAHAPVGGQEAAASPATVVVPAAPAVPNAPLPAGGPGISRAARVVPAVPLPPTPLPHGAATPVVTIQSSTYLGNSNEAQLAQRRNSSSTGGPSGAFVAPASGLPHRASGAPEVPATPTHAPGETAPPRRLRIGGAEGRVRR